MPSFCDKCGATLAADSKFCPSCGHPVAETAPNAESPGSAATSGAPTQSVVAQAPSTPAAPSPPPAPAQAAPPPTTPQAPAATPPASFAPPGGGVAAPPPGHGISPKLIALAAVAALVVAVVALIVFLGGRDTPAATGKSPPPDPAGQEEPPPPPPETGTEEQTSGNLVDSYPPTVGDFELDADSVQREEDAVKDGAIDAAIGRYVSGSTSIAVAQVAFADQDGAVGLYQKILKNMASKGCRTSSRTLKDDSGKAFGATSPFACSDNGGVVLGVNKLVVLFVGPSIDVVGPFVKDFIEASTS